MQDVSSRVNYFFKSEISYFVFRFPMNFSRSHFRNCIFVLFLMNWSKYKHFRSTLHEDFHLIALSLLIVSIQVLKSGRSQFVFSGGPCQISSILVKKICFSVLVLNSIKVKDSRFISGFKFKEKSFCVYKILLQDVCSSANYFSKCEISLTFALTRR